MKIGKKIKSAMIEAKLNQKTLSEKLNVTRQTVYTWVNDKYIPTISSLAKLAEVTNKPLSYFLDDEETIAKTGNNPALGKEQNINLNVNLNEYLKSLLKTKDNFITNPDFFSEISAKIDLILEKLKKKEVIKMKNR
ncbi:MAG: helix-turn-helix domain-containing protein [Endomicrobium sp.]|jgi:transcriptional regulator with XRE-family HTH domain|nr:helix-turn-helix domain-containing protein [Endomicrobium sp.]